MLTLCWCSEFVRIDPLFSTANGTCALDFLYEARQIWFLKFNDDENNNISHSNKIWVLMINVIEYALGNRTVSYEINLKS